MTAQTLAEAQVYDLDGHPHPLQKLWADQRTVLVFVRHYG